MAVISKWDSGRNMLRFFDPARNHKTLHVISPVYWRDNFLGPALSGASSPVGERWTLLDTAGATEALAADVANGKAALALTSTSEAQLAGLSWGDQRPLVLNRLLNIEFVMNLSVLPTGAAIAAWGLAGDHNATLDTVAESILFRADGSGAITVETDDTVNETSLVATGVTLTAGTEAVCRIDCSTITSVKFYINGARVAASTTFNMSQVAALALQPYARVSKGVTAEVGTLQVDDVSLWSI